VKGRSQRDGDPAQFQGRKASPGALPSWHRRRYIHPNFAELRHIVNIAQVRTLPLLRAEARCGFGKEGRLARIRVTGVVPQRDWDTSCAALQLHASADALRLITFDADGTLYADGTHFQQDNVMIEHILSLMKSNVQVCGAGPTHLRAVPACANTLLMMLSSTSASKMEGVLRWRQSGKPPQSLVVRTHLLVPGAS
jgi:hypothetical protein